MEWVTLETFWSIEEAQLAVAYLKARQVPCHLEGTAVAGNFWHLSNATGGVKLLVHPDVAESAGEMLAEVQAQRIAGHSTEITDKQLETDSLIAEEKPFDPDAVAAGDDGPPSDSDEDDDGDERPTFMSRLRENRLMIILFAIAPIYFGIVFIVLGVTSIIVWPFMWISSLATKDEKSVSKST